jgi:hypothetical protein
MQKDAQQGGWLNIWHEFSWWYPWYRLHFKITISDPTTIDVGLNPLLPGAETFSWEGLEAFANVLGEVWQSIEADFIFLLGSYALAKLFSMTTAWIIIEIAKFVVQGLALYAVWGQRDTVLATSVACFIIGLIALSVRVAEQFVDTLVTYIWGPSMTVMYKSMSKGIAVVQGVSSCRTWVDPVEIASDFTWGAVALAHYFGVV